MSTNQGELFPDSGNFDWEKGHFRKEDGMAIAAEHRDWVLEHARQIAVEVALGREDRICGIDDVQRALIREGIKPAQLGNAAGSVFRGDEWEFAGWKQSKRISNHARAVRLWKFIG